MFFCLKSCQKVFRNVGWVFIRRRARGEKEASANFFAPGAPYLLPFPPPSSFLSCQFQLHPSRSQKKKTPLAISPTFLWKTILGALEVEKGLIRPPPPPPLFEGQGHWQSKEEERDFIFLPFWSFQASLGRRMQIEIFRPIPFSPVIFLFPSLPSSPPGLAFFSRAQKSRKNEGS